MLRGLRTATSNWIGKAVLWAVVLLLVVSFAIWGIGDMFRANPRTAVATIGSTEISAEQFRLIFNERVQQLSRQVGRPVTPLQARAIGYDQQILGQLIAEAALDEATRQLGLNVSNDEMAQRIRTDPAFRGITGDFDRTRFDQLIRQSGFTEQRFLAEQRKVYMRRQLALALSDNIVAPRTAAEATVRFLNETRSAEFVALTAETVGDIPAPTPEELQKFYEDRKITFRAPEYRKVVLLPLTPEAMAGEFDVSDDDARKFYDTQIARFSTPEQREVQQIVFPDEESAKAAQAKLKDGEWFENVAAERKMTPADINLGLVTRSAIVDPAVAEAAFGLAPGAVSDPVDGRFGKVIVRVNRVEPAKVAPFEEVSADIKKALAADRARTEINARRDRIEDELAGGSKLDEAAQKSSAPIRVIEAIDRSGRGPDGKLIEGLPQGNDILSNIFAADVGVENDPIQSGGGFVWYEVGGTTPPRDRTLDEVKDRVEQRWREDQISTRLRTRADEIVAALKEGKTFAQVAEASNLKVETATDIRRTGAESLPSTLVSAIFQTAKDGIGQAEGRDANQRMVFKVTDINVPAVAAESEDAKRLAETLKSAIADELLTQYVAKVERTLGTTINRAVLNQALTGTIGN